MANTLEIHRLSLLSRLVDERLTQLARAGKIGFHPDAQRGETVTVAATLALAENDWVFPTPRDHAVAFARGVEIAEYVAHAFGASTDILRGHGTPGTYASKAKRIAPSAPQVSQHLTHATGLAWAAKSRKTDDVVLAFMPETAAEAGDFHTALNFAGVTKAPIIFLCRTDGSEAPAAPVEIADKAVAYGISRAVVSADAGHLPEVVLDAVRDAARKARAGEGATLLEVRHAAEPDPLAALYRSLVATGAYDENADFALRRELHAGIEAAIVQAVDAGAPALTTLVADVYGELPPHLERQLAAARAR